MKLAFTTLACPDWSLETIVKKAAECGFDGVDFRGTDQGLDITLQDQFLSGNAATRRLIEDHGLVTSGVSSSISMCDASLYDDNIEEAKRTIEVAVGLGAAQVRMFGNGDESVDRSERIDVAKRCMEGIHALDGADQIEWLLEIHDIWLTGEDCNAMLDVVGRDKMGILWDIGHSTRIGSESYQNTYAALASSIPCVHLKDAIYQPKDQPVMKDGWRYVLPGKGELPITEAVHFLKEKNYDGWYVFEHEKRWHATLEEPEEALKAFVSWIRSVD
ncbi:sugar phosphate isomerase/epimerase [Akkermansiaceae bacterium]|nr:sugar phosphate isomerase/epimerase [Akkermansiaceae bacterium]